MKIFPLKLMSGYDRFQNLMAIINKNDFNYPNQVKLRDELLIKTKNDVSQSQSFAYIKKINSACKHFFVNIKDIYGKTSTRN